MKLTDHVAAVHTSGGIVTGSSSGTTITTGSSANTKGSYTTLVDPIPNGVSGFWLVIQQNSDAHRWAFDLAIGGAGSEVVIVPNLWIGWKGGHGACRIRINLPLPAGARLSCRAQSSGTTAKTSYVSVMMLRYGLLRPPSYGKMTAYGVVVSSATRGVEVDPGAVADTKGSWFEIAASTSSRIEQLYFSAGYPQSRTGTPDISGEFYFLVDLAIGAGGSEEIRIENWPLAIDRHCDSVSGGPVQGPFDVDIPVGSRIAIRMQSSTTGDVAGDNERRLDFVVYGVN